MTSSRQLATRVALGVLALLLVAGLWSARAYVRDTGNIYLNRRPLGAEF
jgi:hypothetical protein